MGAIVLSARVVFRLSLRRVLSRAAVFLMRRQPWCTAAAVEMIIGSQWLYGAAGNNAFSPIGLAPFAVHVGYVRSQPADGNFQEALAFRGLEKDSFFFGQPMAHRSAANAGLGR
jgi:hypothetical protein